MRKLIAGLVARFKGTGRPRVIAIFGATLAEIETAVRHARTGGRGLPVWAYCAEDLARNSRVDGCIRLVSGRDALRYREDLKGVCPSLTVVAWTRSKSPAVLKSGPCFIPPFRVLVLNEAGDFFPATPAEVAQHARRRARDGFVSLGRRMGDLAVGAGMWTRSLAWRTSERTVDVFRLMWSLAWRASERIGDVARLFRSFAWRAAERIGDLFNWMWESLLALLAFTARWAAPTFHFAAPGSRQPVIGAAGLATNSRFVEVVIPNRGWPRRAVLRAIAQSDIEYVVLRRHGAAAATDYIASLIDLAQDTHSFAVAIQTAHSAWRQCIVTKHPFRRLQAGEVSGVFAPFSPLLIFRRSTLASLGVPRALTYGGALMILFWKASAAGLRSIVAGHDDVVTDEPAMELEDAELALHLKLSRRLAALGPAHPARFRGNVAWSPAYRRAFRGKPRVLIVSPYLPFPLSHGGAVRIYNLCRAMADRVDFVLACFREASETIHYERLHEIFREVYVVDQDARYSDPDLPVQVAEYRNPAMADLIQTLCLGHRVDLVQLEYTQLAEYRDDTGAVPVILVEHDITFTLYRQLFEIDRKLHTGREYVRWLDFEREALQCSNMVWVMSDEDRKEAVAHGALASHTAVIPNGVDLHNFTVMPKPDGPLTVLFIGSFRHLPNLLAFEALRESIMPAVWREFPEAVLHVIAGRAHERAADLAAKGHLLADDPRIVVEGFVEDVRPAYSGADLVVIPLPLSAGTNIKVMEAMACGKAVVSTPAGCRGLSLEHGRELLVADMGQSFSDFSAAVLTLLANEDLRAAIAIEARRTAERRFGWDRIAEAALLSYNALLASPQHVERRLQLAAGVVVPERAGDFDTSAV